MTLRIPLILLTLLTAPPAAAERGADGDLRILYWQAPSTLNPYLSGGIKDLEAASLVLEPLARYDPQGDMTPWLVDVIPTPQNGGVSADRTRITWTLREGLRWSDGSPLTSHDLRFTWLYCTAEGGGCAQAEKFRDVIDVETPDPRTATVVFNQPKPFPYGPFVGPQSPILQAAQFADCLGPRAPTCVEANFAPRGTGPYVVEEFRAGDVVRYRANPEYRDPGKPAFATVTIKGGGDAAAAARAVLETGEFDYAWNLQLAPEVLERMEARGKGRVAVAFGSLVERVAINFTDPDPALGAARSTRAHAHPMLSDPAVRRALSMALDRGVMTEIGYGRAGRPTCDLLPPPEGPDAACLEQDIPGARALLDEAGWTDSDGDGVREKDGKRLHLLLQTSTNAVRQDFQSIMKEWWRQIGIATELRNIDPSVFFGGNPDSPDTLQKFHADLQMYAGAYDGGDAEPYLATWSCDKAPGPENQWQGANVSRFCEPNYDALVQELASAATLDARRALERRMNDMLVAEGAVIPLVDRGRVSAHALDLEGTAVNAWDSELWNIADWRRAAQ
ncbi:peptide ABC transporter substrate-binding protein [Roseovarius spongiae]|uniref:Peptide ABC transporter substrate-binding protein n=1 Tax=Roseovarius spongiae TaxID=2320272 RepID=A0A3A8B9K6_9RHOB|nr:peptide ABC transporter substrate-binding protein [Roseovarius spongiae]RKF14975.1 peptide ABC transporter substrate-binding protein [Roseovarius spongiae]